MHVSVIIPTRHRFPMPALACAQSVEQQLRDQDELIISVDGVECSGDLVSEFSQWARSGRRKIVVGPQAGPGETRNRALAQSTGDLVLFLNDDVIASPHLIQNHRDAHERRIRTGESDAIILGDAPWAIPSDDRVLDRLTRETSWIFFYDQMNNDRPEHDWGFRHAWTLNLSLSRRICEQFDPRFAKPMFDDLDWAYRVNQKYNAKVLYLPNAKVTHHHRYQPEQIFRREVLLGHQAAHLSTVHPEVEKLIFHNQYSSKTNVDLLLNESDERKLMSDFGDFKSVSMLPSESMASLELTQLYSECRGWRNYARNLGALGYYNNLSAQSTMDLEMQGSFV